METQFHNGGDKPLLVPGFGLPIDFELEDEHRFAHGLNDWMQRPRLTVRELRMIQLMDALTDKRDWHEKIFDEEILAKWRKEALSMLFISERTFDWCLQELQDKARAFQKSSYVLTLDTGSRCVKSDTLIDANFQSKLVEAVQPLLHKKDTDWHPNSNEQVLNLVHPSLFPLVYGRSLVMHTGLAEMNDLIESCGKGTVMEADHQIQTRREPGMGLQHDLSNAGRWSARFQWLPCEVKFRATEGQDVQITSYINNLHPEHHQELYSIIEKMITKAIPLWNEVLIREKYPHSLQGRTPPRIKTCGHESDPPELPEWLNDLVTNPERPGYAESTKKVKEYLALPDNPDYDVEEDVEDDQGFQDGSWEEDREHYGAVEWKYRRIRKIVHPEPGVAYSYEDFKEGNTGNNVVGSRSRYASSRDHTYYTINLEDEFRERGLQIIVKLASIELTPVKPEYEGGNWHLEGMLNEHIVATAIYYYNVQNTTESRIRFRQEADIDDMEMSYEQDDHEPLAEIFGTDSLRDEPAVQELGSISTPGGRLLCFPNTLQHKVEPFRLEDASKPGHRRFLVLWLVDPNYRIASTANVPPQQHDWWEPHALRRVLAKSGLPQELQDHVRDDVGGWPMSMEEAKALRLELMQERTNLMPTVEGNFHEYNFCEH